MILKEEVILCVVTTETAGGFALEYFLEAGFGLRVNLLAFTLANLDIECSFCTILAGFGAVSLSLVGCSFEDFGRGLAVGVSIEELNLFFVGEWMTTAMLSLALARSASESVHIL